MAAKLIAMIICHSDEFTWLELEGDCWIFLLWNWIDIETILDERFIFYQAHSFLGIDNNFAPNLSDILENTLEKDYSRSQVKSSKWQNKWHSYC